MKRPKKKKKEIQVFISYRRESGFDIARNIHDRLSQAGYNSFFDHSSVQPSENFNTKIAEAIEQADDFLLILSKDALKRCANTDDNVRKEIELALKYKKHIVLLTTVEEKDDMFPENLPKELDGLRPINAIYLNQHYYDEGIEKIKKSLKSKLSTQNHFMRYFTYVIILLIVGITIWFGRKPDYRPIEPPGHLNGYTATIYLMRYNNLHLRYNCDYNDSVLSLFHYEDSISQQSESEMFIYPASDYIDYHSGQTAKVTSFKDIKTINTPTHLPTIQLKLHSMAKQTLVLTSAELEVDGYRYDDKPSFRFNVTNQKFEILNIGAPVLDEGVLEYSILRDGESFTTYKQRQLVKLNPDYASVTLSRPLKPTDHLVGRLVFQDSTFYNFSGRYGQEQLPDDKEYSLPIPIFDIRNEKKSYRFDDFHYSLVKGETDDNVAFQLRAKCNCIFRIRLKLVSSQGQILYSNYLYVRCPKAKTL